MHGKQTFITTTQQVFAPKHTIPLLQTQGNPGKIRGKCVIVEHELKKEILKFQK